MTMSPKKMTGLLLTFCFCVASIAIIVVRFLPRGTGDAQEIIGGQGASGLYAYTTKDALILMRGDQTVTRIPRDYVPGFPDSNHVVWTNSGRHIATFSTGLLDEQDFSTQELWVIEVQTGKLTRTPCPRCAEVTSIGTDGLLVKAWREDADTGVDYLKFRLDSSNPSSPAPVILGDGNGSFLAGTEDSLLTNQPAPPVGSNQQQIVLHNLLDSSSVDYGYYESNDYVPAAVDRTSSASGTRFAIALNPDAGACISAFPIKILTLDGDVIDTDMRPVEPPGYVAGVQGGLWVNDLWWGPDGDLRASITSWTCDNSKRAENEKQALASANAIWRLEGEQWAKENSGPATMLRDVDDGSRIVLVVPDCIGDVDAPDRVTYCNTGTLHRELAGKQSEIADGVISIYVPPTKRAAEPSTSRSAAPSVPIDPISSMVGTWNVHGAQMVIKPGGAGTIRWNAGPCQDPFQSPETLLCAGHADITFSTSGNNVVGRYGTVVYRDSDDNVVPDHDASGDRIKTGGTFTLVQAAKGVLEETTNTQGNPYWCSSAASASWRTKCNV